jgi:NRPS condensation-like uncharacterized protein
MIKGRLSRFLTVFSILYLVIFICFFRSFNSDTNEQPEESQSSHANAKTIDSNNEQNKIPAQINRQNVENSISSLEPVMTKGVLGNYEPKNLVKIPGPGEGGEGVQLQG